MNDFLDSIQIVWQTSPDEQIVSMVSFKDKVLVATNRKLYEVCHRPETDSFAVETLNLEDG